MNWALVITLSRFFVTPVTIYLIFENSLISNKVASIWMAGLFYFIGSFSDFLDGYVARKYNQVSKLGEFLDPLADKFFTLCVFIAFASISYIYISWIFVILICVREVTITFARIYAIHNNMVMKTEMHGKIKTVVQIFSQTILLFVILHYQVIFQMDSFKDFIGDGSVNDLSVKAFEDFFFAQHFYPSFFYYALYYLPNALVGTACFFTVRSGYHYIKSNWDIFKNIKI